MNDRAYILCVRWEERTNLLPCEQIFCSKCQKLLAIDAKNAPLGYVPICLPCCLKFHEIDFGGFMVGGKKYATVYAAAAAVAMHGRRN